MERRLRLGLAGLLLVLLFIAFCTASQKLLGPGSATGTQGTPRPLE